MLFGINLGAIGSGKNCGGFEVFVIGACPAAVGKEFKTSASALPVIPEVIRGALLIFLLM